MTNSALRHPEFMVGVREMAAVGPGIAAWGVMTGVAMVKSGLSLGAVLFMAVFVFAGSSQLAALPLFAAGAPMWVILATAFCVNLRFIVFSVHLRPYVMHLPFLHRLMKAYLFADLNYVLFIKRFPEPSTNPNGRAARDAYWTGSGVTGWLIWVISSIVGVALAASVPTAWGLGFAGTLALLGLMCSLATSTLRMVAAGIAGAAAVTAYALPLKLNILVAITAAVAAGLLLERTLRKLRPTIDTDPDEDVR
jgi:predicted branched-subunit amino acid permease